ncbi:hypothetical protein ACER0A_009125 [Haloimpatiens sp. FM7315]|uniref:hypothetical protein n=1 Tax=Haloimpatiens sp. FM7315 TaxID=3298609 RepID=UPI0035A36EB4
MSFYSKEALKILRDPSQFSWYVIPLFVLILYMYTKEIGNKNWNGVFAGIAFWSMDLFNEIWNALVFHFTGYSPVWGAPNKTAFLILIGLNIEISFMFALAGLGFTFTLPKDKNKKICGFNNRLVYATLGSIFCVIIECILNSINVLTWEYSFWSIKAPYLIFLIGYLPFFLVSFWVYDMESIKKKFITVSSILGFDVICLIIFAGILKWI